MRRVTWVAADGRPRELRVTECTAPGHAPWLLFAVAGAGEGQGVVTRRRLRTYPRNWAEVSDAELLALYDVAIPAPTPGELSARIAAIAETRRAVVETRRAVGETRRAVSETRNAIQGTRRVSLTASEPVGDMGRSADDDRAERLEFVQALLAAAHDRIEALGAQLAAAETELVATNEELQAMNAELQAAAEYHWSRLTVAGGPSNGG